MPASPALRRLAFFGGAFLLVLGCMSRTDAPEQGGEGDGAKHEGEDFVVWSHNGRAAMTTWRRAGAGVVHLRPDLSLPGPNRLWAWKTTPASVKTLDCICYDPYNLPTSDAAKAEHRVRCARDTTIETLALDELAGDGHVPLLDTLPDDGGADPLIFEGSLSRGFHPLGSVGPYLFLTRRDTLALCGEPKPRAQWTFEVVDVAGPKAAALFTPSELARIEAEEKVEAARALCVAPDCFQPKPEAVKLTLMRPTWSPEGKLGLALQFTTEAGLTAEDGAWDSGTRSVEVDAKVLPAALAPYADTPAPVMEHWKVGGVPTGPAGWAPIDPKLRDAFGG